MAKNKKKSKVGSGTEALTTPTGRVSGAPPDASAGNATADSSACISDNDYKSYLEERKTLHESELSVAKSFDTWLLTLSGGAIATSMAYVKDLVTPGKVVEPWLLRLAWTVFGVVILLGLACMLLSQRAHEDYRRLMDEEFQKPGADVWSRVRERQAKLFKTRLIAWLNRSSIGLFIIGFVLLACFVYANLGKGGVEPMPNEKSSDRPVKPGEKVDFGYVPPTGPVGQTIQGVPPASSAEDRAAKPPIAPSSQKPAAPNKPQQSK